MRTIVFFHIKVPVCRDGSCRDQQDQSEDQGEDLFHVVPPLRYEINYSAIFAGCVPFIFYSSYLFRQVGSRYRLPGIHLQGHGHLLADIFPALRGKGSIVREQLAGVS